MDNRECVLCARKGLVTTTNLEVHHLKHLEDCIYIEAIDLENLITCCKSCHNEQHNRFDGRAKNKNKYASDERW